MKDARLPWLRPGGSIINQRQLTLLITSRSFRLLGSDAVHHLPQLTDHLISLTAACGQVIVGNTCQVMLNHGSKMRPSSGGDRSVHHRSSACALMGAKHILYQAAASSATGLQIGAQPRGPAYETARPL